MRAVDTNLLVRLLVRDDPKQVEASERFIAKGAWVSLLVLQETTWVLERSYGLGRREVGLAIELLLEHESLTLESPNIIAPALADYRASNRVGFSDCLIVTVARAHGHLPLGTFDKRLSKLADVEVPS